MAICILLFKLTLKQLYQAGYFCRVYSKQEATHLKKEFWTVLGKYMSPVLSAEGEKINWINYKTGKKDIFFRMNADNGKASVAIELTHANEQLQALYFEQFKQLRSLLHNILKEEWRWHLHTHDEHGKTISIIYKSIQGINIFNKNDWPELISFFKPRIVALDNFWSEVKYGFEAMK